MEAINVDAEYRQFCELTKGPDMPRELFVYGKVTTGKWVEADGEYFLKGAWEDEQRKYMGTAQPTITPELRELVNLGKSFRAQNNTLISGIIFNALRSLDIEPDTL